MDHIYACIMAGGTGERFWPLSRKTTPKHLLKLFSSRTLLEETVRRVSDAIPLNRIFILTNEAQRAGTLAALSDFPPEQVLCEPAKRDTAPACTFGTAHIHALDPQAIVAFLPADALIKDNATFARQLKEAAEAAKLHRAFITFSIPPAYPATGFGYLKLGQPIEIPKAQSRFFKVDQFVEKPDAATATQYCQSGQYGWNAGMFLWQTELFLQEAKAFEPTLADFIHHFPKTNSDSYVKEKFPQLTKVSVDYAIMEKTKQPVIAAAAEFDWDDVGSWTALSNHMEADAAGNILVGTHAIHDANDNIIFSHKRVVALCGVKDLIVVETEDAILICHRDQAQNLKALQGKLPDSVL